MYGMGTASIAEMINGTTEDAQNLLDSFFNEFPEVKEWIDETEKFAKKYGYVEDWYGRRRRLPDITLKPYEVRYKDNKKNNLDVFNPFLFCKDRVVEDKLLDKYIKESSKIKGYKEYKELKAKAEKDGFDIISNTSFISQAERQSVNARVQGGAATMTKIAMINIFNDELLNKYNFKLLIGVHDELIGECPLEYSEEVAERLSYLMRTCIQDYCEVPFVCDCDLCSNWYSNEYKSAVEKEFKELLESGKTREEALSMIEKSHMESTPEFLREFL